MNTFKVQSIARHRLTTDGKGVTTLVGLLGCPLKCKYCLNKNVIETGRYKEYTPSKLLDKLLIDYCYFVATGGGITFGGAEPLFQTDALLEFIDILPEYININIESSLNVNLQNEVFEALAKKVNQFIIDIKTTDEKLYERYTGMTNEFTLKNIERIKALDMQDKCRIRIPIIPKYKDKAIAEAEAYYMNKMGFSNTEVFGYIIRDYM